MTPEAQRIAIAESCGWKRTPEGSKSAWFNPALSGLPGRSMFRNRIPDYLNDLNAMHEAEKTLEDEEQQQEYLGWLCASFRPLATVALYQWEATHATAAQRAEAFLRTIGKWEDSK